MPGPDPDPADRLAALADELDALHRASEDRSAELRDIAARLPAVVGRRAMIRTFLGDIRANPNKTEIARRGTGKLWRELRGTTTDLVRRLPPRR